MRSYQHVDIWQTYNPWSYIIMDYTWSYMISDNMKHLYDTLTSGWSIQNVKLRAIKPIQPTWNSGYSNSHTGTTGTSEISDMTHTKYQINTILHYNNQFEHPKLTQFRWHYINNKKSSVSRGVRKAWLMSHRNDELVVFHSFLFTFISQIFLQYGSAGNWCILYPFSDLLLHITINIHCDDQGLKSSEYNILETKWHPTGRVTGYFWDHCCCYSPYQGTLVNCWSI